MTLIQNLVANFNWDGLPVDIKDDDFHRNILVSLGIHPVALSAEEITLERKIFYDKICHNMKLPLISINI